MSEYNDDSLFDYLTMLSVSRLNSVDQWMINEYDAVGGMRIGRGNRGTGQKPASLPFCATKTPT
jgi:hypothetical protein